MKIAQNITQLIGGTPIVALNNIPKKDGSLAKIVLKLESLNPSLSGAALAAAIAVGITSRKSRSFNSGNSTKVW